MFRKVGVFIFVLMLSMIGQTALAGHWLLPAEAITVTGEVSNQRWVEDDGTYASRLRPMVRSGRYRCFNLLYVH
jgi:hypothetical protein